jgi:TusA-related sulfurtransferase
MTESTQKKIVDSRGSYCPGPLTDLFKTYRESQINDLIEIWATDPAAKSDIQAWASRSGNTVLEIIDEKDYIKILVRIDKKGR